MPDQRSLDGSPVDGRTIDVRDAFEEIIGGTLGKVVVALFASSIHLSGHPSAEELRLLRALVRPRRFVPIHGEYRQLAFHGRLAATLSGATHRC